LSESAVTTAGGGETNEEKSDLILRQDKYRRDKPFFCIPKANLFL